MNFIRTRITKRSVSFATESNKYVTQALLGLLEIIKYKYGIK